MISIIRVNNIIQKAWCILYSPVSDLIVIVHKLCGMIWLNDSHADTKQLATLVSNLCLSSLWVTAAAIPYHTSYVSSRQGGKSVDIIHFAYSSTRLIGAYSNRDKAKRERPCKQLSSKNASSLCFDLPSITSVCLLSCWANIDTNSSGSNCFVFLFPTFLAYCFQTKKKGGCLIPSLDLCIPHHIHLFSFLHQKTGNIK